MRHPIRPSISLLVCCTIASLLWPSASTLAAKNDLPKTQGWIEVKTAHFTLYSNAGSGRTRKIAVQLERFRQALGRITRGFDLNSDVPTLTFVFKNDPTYVPYKRNAEGETMNVSGYFQPRPFRNYITLDSSAGSQPLRVVYHEFFHSVMNNTMGSLPPWLGEGMAEYFSTFKDRDGSATVEVGHPIDRHLRHLDDYGLLDWDEFFETTRSSPTYNEGTRQGSFYAQAWLLIHYLNSQDQYTKQLGKYLGLLRGGEDEDAAFREAFGKDKAALGAQVKRYSEKGSGYVWWDFGEEHREVATAVRELDAGEVYFRLGELLAQRGQPEAAGKHLSAARSEGWPVTPIDTAFGVASMYGGDPAVAETDLRRAVVSEDTSAEPYVLLGELVMQRFFDTPESERYNKDTPELVQEARGLFELGLVRQPGHFETLLALSRTYLFGGQDAADGLRAIDHARSIRPLDPHMLQAQASLLARNGDVREACRVIEREIRPKDDVGADKTTRFVANSVMAVARERIESGDREGAKQVLASAAQYLPDASLADQMRELHEFIAAGGRLVFDEDEDQGREESPLSRALAEYNGAIELANSGRHEEAMVKFEKVAEDCIDEELCAKARKHAADLRHVIETNE